MDNPRYEWGLLRISVYMSIDKTLYFQWALCSLFADLLCFIFTNAFYLFVLFGFFSELAVQKRLIKAFWWNLKQDRLQGKWMKTFKNCCESVIVIFFYLYPIFVLHLLKILFFSFWFLLLSDNIPQFVRFHLYFMNGKQSKTTNALLLTYPIRIAAKILH